MKEIDPKLNDRQKRELWARLYANEMYNALMTINSCQGDSIEFTVRVPEDFDFIRRVEPRNQASTIIMKKKSMKRAIREAIWDAIKRVKVQ